MNLVLKVSSSNENYNGGCDFAFVELTAEIAAIALRRIQTLKEQKKLDADIDETYYWSHFVECFFSPWANLAGADRDVEAASPRWWTCCRCSASRLQKSPWFQRPSRSRSAKWRLWSVSK